MSLQTITGLKGLRHLSTTSFESKIRFRIILGFDPKRESCRQPSDKCLLWVLPVQRESMSHSAEQLALRKLEVYEKQVASAGIGLI